LNDRQAIAGLCLALVFVLAAFAIVINRPTVTIQNSQDPIRILNVEAVQTVFDREIFLVDYAVGTDIKTAQLPTQESVGEFLDYLRTLGVVQEAQP
jgi:hypothetical protein